MKRLKKYPFVAPDVQKKLQLMNTQGIKTSIQTWSRSTTIVPAMKDFLLMRFLEPYLLKFEKSINYLSSFSYKIPFEIVKYPIFSDKGFQLIEQSQYIFAVDVKATKFLIKIFMKQLFNVKVDFVNTLLLLAKKRSKRKFKVKKSRYKQAFIKLVSGDNIKIFEEANLKN